MNGGVKINETAKGLLSRLEGNKTTRANLVRHSSGNRLIQGSDGQATLTPMKGDGGKPNTRGFRRIETELDEIEHGGLFATPT